MEITRNLKTKFASVFKVARRDKMRVVWLEDNLVYCARREKGHDRYLVRFDVAPDGRVTIHCRSVSGPECHGMRFKGLCAHAAKVILRGLPKCRKKETQEAA